MVNAKAYSFIPGCYMDGQGKDRCETNGKVAYRSEEEAKAGARYRRFYTRTDLRPYWAKSCGHWHLTSSPQ